VKFLREMVPDKFEKTADGKVKVYVQGKELDTYDTVLMAVGREGCASWLDVEKAGLTVEKQGKLKVNDDDQTIVPHIYAIGDVAQGKPELTPVAIQAGRYLVRRLFGKSTKRMDYVDVATAVFTPIEYGAVGYSEEDAITKYGKDNVKVYHSAAMPLEWNVNPHRASKKEQGYMKVITVPDKTGDEWVIGFHVLGGHAGEIIQGIAVAIKCKLNKQTLDDTVGIHPTFAESYTTMSELKVEGVELKKAGC